MGYVGYNIPSSVSSLFVITICTAVFIGGITNPLLLIIYTIKWRVLLIIYYSDLLVGGLKDQQVQLHMSHLSFNTLQISYSAVDLSCSFVPPIAYN